MADNTVIRRYAWGLDLSGQGGDGSVGGLHGAGGVGGLVGVQDLTTGRTYAVVHDAAGNVSELLDRDALALYAASAQGGGGGGQPNPALLAQAIVAHYEYDAYGNVTMMTGPYAAANRIRFSDKYIDTELDWPTTLGGGQAPGGADPTGGSGSGGGSGGGGGSGSNPPPATFTPNPDADGLNSNAVLRQYTWGLDLSGQNGDYMGGTGVSSVGIPGTGGICGPCAY